MLPIHLAVLKAITTSALSLQLAQPVVPVESNSALNLTLPSRLQGPINASLRADTLDTGSQQWDGTIAFSPNKPNIPISLPSSDDPSESWNDTYISRTNISTGFRGPKPAQDLPPFPRDWRFACYPAAGTNMNPSSCLDAWALLPPLERVVSFGPRSAANRYDVGLPRRYLSFDGTCFIEPRVVSGHTEAYAKPSDAGIAAAYVIRQCVGDRALGGTAQNLESRNDLAVDVGKFMPRVVCSERPFPRDTAVLVACQSIVDQMNASVDTVLFAQMDVWDPALETPLPFEYIAPMEAPKCILRVTGRFPRQFGSWYRIWEAAVAITAMCVRQGKGGRWEGLGAAQSLRVEMGKRQQPAVEAE